MKIDSKCKCDKLIHTWSKCIGAGRAAEGLRREWIRQLSETVKACGFEYIRFHGLLSEDMFVVHQSESGIEYNWYCIDQVYDALQEIGIRPIVELGFMPPALASGDQTQFWWKGNVTPPKDYKEWGNLIRALSCHLIERYGLDEVLKWYFEVWNEPNLHAFWGGTRTQYFELYRETVQVIKSIDSRIKVGGPATSNFVPDDRFNGETEDYSKHITHLVEDIDTLEWKGVWIEEFLLFCEREGLPVDFVSAHPYSTDFALDGQQTLSGRTRKVDSLSDDITYLRSIVSKSAFPNAEIHLTEWSSSPTSRDYSHDFLPVASYIIESCLDNAGRTNSLSYWVFTDIFEEEGGGPEALHGGFGLMTMHGIKKPSWWAYYFLNSLGCEQLYRGEESIVTRTSESKTVALFWNYAKELKQAIPIATYPHYEKAVAIEDMGKEKIESVHLCNLTPNAVFCLETLDKEHSVAWLWRKMGCPRNLNKNKEESLKNQTPNIEYINANANGELKLDIVLHPWTVVLLKEL